jgi:hypothetical protein
MKKSSVLFLIGVVVQTVGITGFPIVSASSQAAIGKFILLVLVGSGLLMVLLQLAKQLEFREMLRLAAGFAAFAVCTHQLLGFLLYPGLLKDVELMSPEHAWLTLMVFTLVTVGYLAGYGLIRLGRRLLRL